MTRSKAIGPTDPPNEDQFEVSIFGPGKGEALAVHLGGGEWLTVDSCRDVGSGEHPVLRYLDAIGVDVESQVRLVVGTHAHDDHMAGMGQLYRRAQAAQYVSSAAVHVRQIFAMVEAEAEIEQQAGVAVRAEIRAVLEEVERRGRTAQGLKLLTHAFERRILLDRPGAADCPPARVTALSPSDEAISRAQDYLASGTAKISQRKRLSAADPNEFAIALWVEVGQTTALLGADLLRGPAGCGWEAILVSGHRATPKATLFKVPHHGSITSEHPEVWSEMLEDGVVSVLAPYRSGRKFLPDEEDVRRIRAKSGSSYVSAGPKLPAPAAAVKATKAKLLGVASNVREPEGRSGHVCARWDSGRQAWSVETYWPAQPL